MAKRSLFGKLVGIAKRNNDFAFQLTEKDNPYDIKSWTDTGCFALNALLSDGDIFKGLLDGKRVMISGASSTAKSLFTAFIIAVYLKANKDAYAVFFETEGSTITRMAETVGIPEDRIVIIPVGTVEECRTQLINLLDPIVEDKKERLFLNRELEATKAQKKRTEITKKIAELGKEEKFIFCIDSLGMLSTFGETEKIASGAATKDMTRAALIKAMARTTSLKLSFAGVPMIVVNHQYATMSQYTADETSGGSGPKYMSDIHIGLFKGKEKDGSKKQIGVKIKLVALKSRFMIEGKEIDIILHFKKGLYKLSSMIDKAADLGVLKKKGQSFIFPDGSEEKMKEVRSKPSKYITKELLQLIGVAIKDDFGFGEFDQNVDIESDMTDIDEEKIEEMIDKTEEFDFEEEVEDGTTDETEQS